MNKEKTIEAFVKLGEIMHDLGNDLSWRGYESGVTEQEYDQLREVINKEQIYNGWFTAENVRKSLISLAIQLTQEKLVDWTKKYKYTDQPKKIAVIMAGNIPLVGFHDFLCVLMSGNKILAKLSSDDNRLLTALVGVLIHIQPEFADRIKLTQGKLEDFDAVIATGSNNSFMYFESYFGKHPHLFRKNRTSVAVINGDESAEELELLGSDLFDYFGLGCRNVSHIILPAGFDLDRIFGAIVTYSEVVNNKKYGNNYDYNKAVHLMNKIPLLDNNFVLFRESEELFSPLAMIHYHYYSTKQEVKEYLQSREEEIQAVIGRDYIPFGSAQCPMLDDYADGVDTMKWLNELDN